MQRLWEMRKHILQLTQQIQKKRVCGYATSKSYLSKIMLKESPKEMQQSKQGNEATMPPNRFHYSHKLVNGARIPTAVSCLIGMNTHSPKPRNEWQMATIEYSKSMNTLEQAARQLYKNAKLKPTVSVQGKSIKVSNSSVPLDVSSSFFGASNRIEGDKKQEPAPNNKTQLSELSLRLMKLFMVEPEPIYNASTMPGSLQRKHNDADEEEDDDDEDNEDEYEKEEVARKPQGSYKSYYRRSTRKS